MANERLGFLVTDNDLEPGVTKADKLEEFLRALNERQPDYVEYETTIYLGDDEIVLVKLEWEDPPLRVVDVPEESDTGRHLTPGVAEQEDPTDFVDITKGVQTGEISDLFNGGFPEGLDKDKEAASFVPGGIFTPPQDMMDRALATTGRRDG